MQQMLKDFKSVFEHFAQLCINELRVKSHRGLVNIRLVKLISVKTTTAD